jgi:2-hydroxymuconate-semialdehyde hydrolase
VIAPDMVGFGFTDRPEGVVYGKELWVRHLGDFLDALGIAQVDLVGNSFGGALVLAFAIAHPERVGRLVLMGSAGLSFPLDRKGSTRSGDTVLDRGDARFARRLCVRSRAGQR